MAATIYKKYMKLNNKELYLVTYCIRKSKKEVLSYFLKLCKARTRESSMRAEMIPYIKKYGKDYIETLSRCNSKRMNSGFIQETIHTLENILSKLD